LRTVEGREALTRRLEEKKFRLVNEAREKAREARKELVEAAEAVEKAVKEEAEAVEAERKAREKAEDAKRAKADAEKELQEADDAKADLDKEEADVLREEEKLKKMEQQLTPGSSEYDEQELREQREKVSRERQEADEAGARWQKEKDEADVAHDAATKAVEAAEAALETAKQERAEAEAAKAKAAIEKKEAREAIKAATDANERALAQTWVEQRVKRHQPLEETDKIYQLIYHPAETAAKQMKKESDKKRQREIDNYLQTIHQVCEYVWEDHEFLEECFHNLHDEDDHMPIGDEAEEKVYYITEEGMKTWLHVLNGGKPPGNGATCTEAPSPEKDYEETVANLDEYREALGAQETCGVFEESDFLLVTFDYYLALGYVRMRQVWIDLLLT
jgi:chromosome segregation ATPase